MANSIARVYCNAVRKNQKVLYGVWEPGFPVQLGDFGVMKGNIFVHMGNISQFKELKSFKIKYRKDDTRDEKTFMTDSGIELTFTPKAGGTTHGVKANASLEIKFSKENSVFFNGAECMFEMIENKYELGQKIIEMYKNSKGSWKREFVLVTDRVVTRRALILISRSNNFSATFYADAKIPNINLAKAELGLHYNKINSGGYHVNTEEGIVPLIGISKIKPQFMMWGEKFNPLTKSYTTEMTEAVFEQDVDWADINDEELYFTQYTDDLDE